MRRHRPCPNPSLFDCGARAAGPVRPLVRHVHTMHTHDTTVPDPSNHTVTASGARPVRRQVTAACLRLTATRRPPCKLQLRSLACAPRIGQPVPAPFGFAVRWDVQCPAFRASTLKSSAGVSVKLFGHVLSSKSNVLPHMFVHASFGCPKFRKPDTNQGSRARVLVAAMYAFDTPVSTQRISRARTLSGDSPLSAPHSCRSRVNAANHWSRY